MPPQSEASSGERRKGEWGVVWRGMSPSQRTMGSGKRRELPSGSGAEPRPETRFGGVFYRPQNALFVPITNVFGMQG